MLNRATQTAFCILLLAFQCFGQRVEPSSGNLPLEPIPSMKKAVAFIRVVYQKNGVEWNSEGTGFFVMAGDKQLPEGQVQGFPYLVTNRHVVEPGAPGPRFRVLRTYLRVNLRTPGARDKADEIELQMGRSLRWYFPADGADDLAVLPIAPDPQKFDYVSVPMSDCAIRSVVASEGIAEGDRVVFSGLFYQFPGAKMLEPIVREGIVAMMPGEKMATTLQKPGWLYLGDVHIFGGNSGSPVFVNTGGTRGNATRGDKWWLLGVVSGYMNEDADFNLTVATTVHGKLRANSGICTIVPVDELKALLEQPELQKLREDGRSIIVR